MCFESIECLVPHVLGLGVSYLHLCSISLIEPGPVITEFERKVYEDGLKIDLSKADKVTADMFHNIYLKNYKQIFESLGQTPEEVAEVLAGPVETLPKCFNLPLQ